MGGRSDAGRSWGLAWSAPTHSSSASEISGRIAQTSNRSLPTITSPHDKPQARAWSSLVRSLVIPIVVTRPLQAVGAACVRPLQPAAGTDAMGIEGVPAMEAHAGPEIMWARFPQAFRTADAATALPCTVCSTSSSAADMVRITLEQPNDSGCAHPASAPPMRCDIDSARFLGPL
jgi:hypothetical protein